MILLGSSTADIEKAAQIIKDGGLAAFPTETVYGLGADAFNVRAIARVFEVKDRPRFDPLIVHIASLASLETAAVPELLSLERRADMEKLIAVFWPGPLTLILPRRPELPALVSAGLPTAALRMPSHPLAQKLIRLSTGALAAPSANPFGRLSPTRAEHVIEGLGGLIDCVIDGGACEVGVESTVLDLCGDAPRLLRPGGISREEIEILIGPVEQAAPQGAGANTVDSPASRTPAASLQASPGMLKSHYAPKTPLILHNAAKMAALPLYPGDAYLFWKEASRNEWMAFCGIDGGAVMAGRIFFLAETSLTMDAALKAAAANLFERLHRLDHSGARRIHAEILPERGPGAAVNDRLRRGAAPSG